MNSPHPDVPGAVYLAPRDFESELETELSRRGCRILFRKDRLIGTKEKPIEAVWAENVWLEPFFLPIRSIADGAAQLKAIQRNWGLFSTNEHRRAALIQEALPKVSARPLVFGQHPPVSPIGSWTLWSHDCILVSARCSSPFVNGEARFVEDKTGPPSRAYLKLWETFTRIGCKPSPGDLCLDLGSAPGSWTWVLAGLGARVFSVDKAPLAPEIARNPLVEYCRGSAFGLDPGYIGQASWLFCDVICYPERLLTMVQRWIASGIRMNMVCTIKFVGTTDFPSLDAFGIIPNSRTMHLYANKHEVTWVHLVNRPNLL